MVIVATTPVAPLISVAHTCTPDPVIDPPGRLLVPSGSGIAAIELATRERTPIPIGESQGVTNAVARSRDGATLAVARFWRPPRDRVGGQDIFLIPSVGGAPVGLVARATPGELLGSPSWMPDGSLVIERQSITGGEARLERVQPSGERQPIIQQALFGNTAPSGQSVAFVRPSRTGDRLMIHELGSGTERVIAEDPNFVSIAFPRFSPDGQWVAFAAASDPSVARMPSPAHWLVSVAQAHGLPWDIWVVRVDGTERRRVSFFYDDDPSPAWSPDGRWITVFGLESVKIVAFDSPQVFCVDAVGGFGGIEWVVP
jgi:Tol biopolymer transport system component